MFLAFYLTTKLLHQETPAFFVLENSVLHVIKHSTVLLTILLIVLLHNYRMNLVVAALTAILLTVDTASLMTIVKNAILELDGTQLMEIAIHVLQDANSVNQTLKPVSNAHLSSKNQPQ